MSDETNIIAVDLNELGILVENGKDILFTPTAETGLLRLLELEEMVKKALESAKQIIEAAALKYNPNFTSVQSDRIKVKYRFYGAKYAMVDNHKAAELPDGLVKTETKVTYSLNSKAIDKYVEQHGELPDNIALVPRSKKISIKKADDEDEGDE